MHMIKQDQNKVHNMDLLWRYYEKSRSFGKAAHVLARLADMQRWDGFFLISGPIPLLVYPCRAFIFPMQMFWFPV